MVVKKLKGACILRAENTTGMLDLDNEVVRLIFCPVHIQVMAFRAQANIESSFMTS